MRGPAPGALMPSQPLFSKRASALAGVTATRPSMVPLLTIVVPTADGPSGSHRLPGAAMIEPMFSSVPYTPFISTPALPAPVTVMEPLLVTTP